MADQPQQPAAPTTTGQSTAAESRPGSEPPAAGQEQAKPTAFAPSDKPGGYYWGTGRRKASVARVRIRPGEGKVQINNRSVEDYFHERRDRDAVVAPLLATETLGKFDVFANVHGGGFAGQAGAMLLGVARALVAVSESFEPKLRDAGFLTRDGRMKERKKYGQKGARKRFQWTKR